MVPVDVKTKRTGRRWKNVPWKIRWFIWLIVAIIAFYLIENFRGWYSLNQYIKRGIDQGEWFDEASRKRSLPERKGNLLTHPKTQPGITGGGLFQRGTGGFDPAIHLRERYGVAVCTPFPIHRAFRAGENLTPEEAAQKFLDIAREWKSDLDAFCEAVDASDHVYFPLPEFEIGESHLKYLSPLRNTNRGLGYRAFANLRLGNAAEARKEIIVSLRLGSMLLQGDNMIEHLMGAATIAFIANPIWEGIRKRKWSDADYVSFIRELEKPKEDPPFDMFLTERAFALKFLESIDSFPDRVRYVSKTSGSSLGAMLGLPKPTLWERIEKQVHNGIFCICPDGWFKLWAIEQQEDLRSQVFPGAVSGGIPSYSKCWIKAKDQDYEGYLNSRRDAFVLIRLLLVACANERYFLKHGKYSERLTDLAPEFISAVPVDPFSGKDFLYIPAGVRSERPVIYSVGRNGLDDGGYQVRRREHGDVVWQYELPEGFTVEDYRSGKIP